MFLEPRRAELVQFAIAIPLLSHTSLSTRLPDHQPTNYHQIHQPCLVNAPEPLPLAARRCQLQGKPPLRPRLRHRALTRLLLHPPSERPRPMRLPSSKPKPLHRRAPVYSARWPAPQRKLQLPGNHHIQHMELNTPSQRCRRRLLNRPRSRRLVRRRLLCPR